MARSRGFCAASTPAATTRWNSATTASRCFAGSLGLLICTTPPYSPESNGMAEAFVKTLRRDYVYLSRVDNADVVLAQLPRWIEDYNEVHPHKGLKMRSPREYRRAVQ